MADDKTKLAPADAGRIVSSNRPAGCPRSTQRGSIGVKMPAALPASERVAEVIVACSAAPPEHPTAED